MEKSRARGTKNQLQIRRCPGAQSGKEEEDKGWVSMALESVLRRKTSESGKAWWEGERQAVGRCGQMSALESSLLVCIQALLIGGQMVAILDRNLSLFSHNRFMHARNSAIPLVGTRVREIFP